MGQMYFVFNTREHIHVLAGHFDDLKSAAAIGIFVLQLDEQRLDVPGLHRMHIGADLLEAQRLDRCEQQTLED